MQSVRHEAARGVEFGIYRDGDNNLDLSQRATLVQALQTSSANSTVEYTVEDTTSAGSNRLHTNSYTIADGKFSGLSVDPAHDMASPKNLAQFVAQTLDNAERSGAKQTWIDLVDHGAGDGGGLEADSAKSLMAMPQIAGAIAQGVELHAQAHPEDAGRGVDGVLANQCLMSSLGFADALSHAGVHWLAASPETMVSPGAPSDVAAVIAAHENDSAAMGKAIVKDVMQHVYGTGFFTFQPAAAFDVIDVDRKAFSPVELTVKEFNDAIAGAKGNHAEIVALREDGRVVDGMARIPDATPDMPWHADRPAIALFDTIAHDGRLDPTIRDAALRSEQAVKSIVVAHAETNNFRPFGGSDYTDAAGPTIHFPTKPAQIDPWAPRVTETHNRFFSETDAAAAERVVA